MQILVSCPDCGVPAEITERFCLPSTDGPVDHVVVHCAADHHFRVAADRLPAFTQIGLSSNRVAAFFFFRYLTYVGSALKAITSDSARQLSHIF